METDDKIKGIVLEEKMLVDTVDLIIAVNQSKIKNLKTDLVPQFGWLKDKP